ncbi:MAG: hypothetical protein IM537_12865 [Pseudanabaena sp. M57BS1SP1A06MG]|jgi:hypothetical protein|nr:hypothetical protein [Pseudanabaena sp. M53BS1SP1A06MG]MCA6601063.1 hypothetical protein [Pseudanabaena sp. M57BS1SP1A06MG]
MDDEAFSPSGFDSISTEQSAPPAIEPTTYSDSSTHQVLNGDAYSNDNPSYNHSDSYNNYVTQDFSTPTHSLTPEYVDHNNSYISGNDGSNTSDMYGDGSIPSYNTSTPDINAESNIPSLDSHQPSGIGGEISDVPETSIHDVNSEQDTGITPLDASTLPEPNHGESTEYVGSNDLSNGIDVGNNIPSLDSHQPSGIGDEISDVPETPIHDVNSEQDTGITPLDASTLPEPNHGESTEYAGSNDLGNGIDPITSHENTNDGEVPIHEPQLDKEHVDVEINIPFINSPNPSGIEPELSNHQKPYIDTTPELGSPNDIVNNPASTSETNANGINLGDVAKVAKAFNFGAVAGGSIDFLQSIAHRPNNLMKAIEVGSLGVMQMARYELGYTVTEKMFEKFLGENDKNDISTETIRSAIQGCVGGVAATFSIAGCAGGAFYETILTTGKYGIDALSDSTGIEWLKPYAYGAAGLGAGVLTGKFDEGTFGKLSSGISAAIYEQTRDGLFPDDKPINNNGDK